MAAEPENLIDFVLTKGNGVTGLSQLKAFPKQYIQPPAQRLDQSQVTVLESVPIVDVSEWDSNPKVADSICEAAARWGFFQIIKHGIPVEVLGNVKRAVHEFFELPVEERRKYKKENSPTHTVLLGTSFRPTAETVLEWKDILAHICDGQENEHSKLWPPVSRHHVLEYINRAKPVIRKLLEALLKGLNMKQTDMVKDSLMGKLGVPLLYYPICPKPDLAAGAGCHSDASSITVLLQDDVGGLYVRAPDGEKWIHVRPVEGALVVNIGDVMQIVSNDRYKSIEHRVVVSGRKNRVSVPIFVNPAPDTVIGPLLEDGEKPMYKQVVYKDYFNHFFSKGRDGKQTLDFARI